VGRKRKTTNEPYKLNPIPTGTLTTTYSNIFLNNSGNNEDKTMKFSDY